VVWLIIVGVLVLIVVSALLKDTGSAFPPNRRRRSLKRGVVNVSRPADDPYPYEPVIVEPEFRYNKRIVHTSPEESDRVPSD
jgi:hypothetical protein